MRSVYLLLVAQQMRRPPYSASCLWHSVAHCWCSRTTGDANVAKAFPHINVFIASPSDCEVERQLVREAVRHVSDHVAHTQGCHIQAVGWEDEPPRAGRPQDVINHQVDECDWALFFLNRRWGSPTGTHTSGFHEEFCRARERYRQTGAPHVALFFRDVPASIVADPGEQLQQNLAFRDAIFGSKEFLVKTYRSPEDLPDMLRGYMSEWVLTGRFTVEPVSSREAELQEQVSRLQEALAQHGQKDEELRSAIELLAESKPAQAEASLRRQLEAPIQDPNVLVALASSLSGQGRHQDSLDAIERALTIRPDHPEALYAKGVLLLILGREEDALTTYDCLLEILPDNPYALLNRGVALEGLGRRDDALVAYDRALDRRPDQPSALKNRALLFFETGDLDSARSDLERLVDLRCNASDCLNLCCLEIVARDIDAAGQSLLCARSADTQDESEAVFAWFGAAVSALSGDAVQARALVDQVNAYVENGASSSRSLCDMFPAIDATLPRDLAEILRESANRLRKSSSIKYAVVPGT